VPRPAHGGLPPPTRPSPARRRPGHRRGDRAFSMPRGARGAAGSA